MLFKNQKKRDKLTCILDFKILKYKVYFLYFAFESLTQYVISVSEFLVKNYTT